MEWTIKHHFSESGTLAGWLFDDVPVMCPCRSRRNVPLPAAADAASFQLPPHSLLLRLALNEGPHWSNQKFCASAFTLRPKNYDFFCSLMKCEFINKLCLVWFSVRFHSSSSGAMLRAPKVMIYRIIR